MITIQIKKKKKKTNHKIKTELKDYSVLISLNLLGEHIVNKINNKLKVY